MNKEELQNLFENSEAEQKRRHEWVEWIMKKNPNVSYFDANMVYSDMRITQIQMTVNRIIGMHGVLTPRNL